ncbi:MAG: hypothetical protein HY824_09225 [Acidobacteria bacterium]|nr:hypothetical protein [Acidobacteriota bacterium]
MHVRWSRIDQALRVELERRFDLREPVRLDDDNWSYLPGDRSPETFRAIVGHPLVVWTDGIDRVTFGTAASPPLSARRGGFLAGASPWMARAARAAKLAGYGLMALAVLILAGLALAPVLVDRGWTLRGLPRLARVGIARGVPEVSPEAAGLFRIIFGAGVVLFVTRHPVSADLLPPYDLAGALGPYGIVVRWLSLHAGVGRALGPWLATTGLLFVAGLLTRTAFAGFVGGVLLWACVYTVTTTMHTVSALAITLICLLAARWGDAYSVDAALRRAFRRPPRPVPAIGYGFAVWVPRLVFGVAFLAAAWSKVGHGSEWILNGTVKYHFVTDLDHALVAWGPRLTSYHWVAVLMSASAVAVETLLVTAAFSRSAAYRLSIAAATLALLSGFALFQGIVWGGWWVLLLAFLPWERLRLPSTGTIGVRAAPAAAPSFSRGQVAVVAVLGLQQFVVSCARIEARPVLSAYDMYSSTYGSAEEYEHASNLVYRLVVFDGERASSIPECPINDRAAAQVPAAAGGAGEARERVRALLRPCLPPGRAPSAIVLEGDRRVYNWTEGRFEWRRAVDVIGPFPAGWLYAPNGGPAD